MANSAQQWPLSGGGGGGLLIEVNRWHSPHQAFDYRMPNRGSRLNRWLLNRGSTTVINVPTVLELYKLVK